MTTPPTGLPESLAASPLSWEPAATCRHCGARMPWLDERWYGLTAHQVEENQRAMYGPGHEPWPGRAPLWTIPDDARSPTTNAAVPTPADTPSSSETIGGER